MPPKGQHLSQEAKQKIRLARLGTHHTDEWKINHSKKISGINHHMYGKHWPEEIKEKIRSSLLGTTQSEELKQKRREMSFGQDNNHWKGDDVGNRGLHQWIRKHLQCPSLCQICNLVPPIDLANVTGIYARGFENWKYLCRKCHFKYDRTEIRRDNNGRIMAND